MRLADVINVGMPALIEKHGHHLTTHQRKALRALTQCRTGELGSSVMRCDDCSRWQVQQRSCGHRSCPQCQQHHNKAWLMRQQSRLLPAHYFMVTFTLPAQLRPLAYKHPREIYAILFQTAISTLNTFAQNHPDLKAKPGICAVLHTHSRQLDYHPHLHCIVPGCAIDKKRRQWRKLKSRYLFNGKQLATVFRARFLEKLANENYPIPDRMPKKWNVQCKLTGNGLPALKYLSRYLYRGVINERDLLHLDEEQQTVCFRYLHSKTKELRKKTLSIADFLWRIAMQILPRGYRRSRDYGFNQGNAKIALKLLQLLLRVVIPDAMDTEKRPIECQYCQGPLRFVRFFKPG